LKNNDLVQVIEDSEEFYKHISKNIKSIRTKYKYTQLDFSAHIGFNSVSFYCDCENNKNGKHFNLLHVVRIAKFLNIDINEIIT
jgi:DNA-binding XRE family transcriptional regulator